jgi:hypothetical protein
VVIAVTGVRAVVAVVRTWWYWPPRAARAGPFRATFELGEHTKQIATQPAPITTRDPDRVA